MLIAVLLPSMLSASTLNSRDSSGHAPITAAASGGDVAIVALLLIDSDNGSDGSRKVDSSVRSVDGGATLSWAAADG
jgi:ankyrin repeat protein